STTRVIISNGHRFERVVAVAGEEPELMTARTLRAETLYRDREIPRRLIARWVGGSWERSGAGMAEQDGTIAPFGGDGVWLRCGLHAHTTMSDGMLDPFMLRRYYTLGGFDVLAITDHDTLTPPPERADRGPTALLLPGAELSLKAPISGGPLHVVALGIRELPSYTLETPLEEVVAAINEQGGVAIVAHPFWSGLLTEELGDLAGVAAIEVYNDGCEVEQSRGDSAYYWDCQLARGVRVNAIATDDHHLPGFNAFQGWTMVRAAEQTPHAILDALRNGAFYSSSGPAIHAIHLDEGGLVVETSPAVAIAVLGQPPAGARMNAGPHGLSIFGERRLEQSGLREGLLEGQTLTYARFPRVPGLRYIRVEVIDARGRRAWSNPIWPSDTEATSD
ncbi:MAG: CehA/McbA family metallohydrolase, partial [Vicinamibacterales bacterium]